MEAVLGRYRPLWKGVSLPVELDTGSAVSIISELRWKNELRGTTLRPSSAVLKTVTGEIVRLLGFRCASRAQ